MPGSNRGSVRVVRNRWALARFGQRGWPSHHQPPIGVLAKCLRNDDVKEQLAQKDRVEPMRHAWVDAAAWMSGPAIATPTVRSCELYQKNNWLKWLTRHVHCGI